MSLIGTFIPKNKRQALVKDLRATHFSLGFRSDNPKRPNQSLTVVSSPHKKSNSSVSNISLGRSKSVIKNISNSVYTPKQIVRNTSINKDQHSNTHHFTLGSYQFDSLSSSPLQTSFELETAKSHLKNENLSSIVLGSSKEALISTNKAEFTEKQIEKPNNKFKDFKKFIYLKHFENGKYDLDYSTTSIEMNKNIKNGKKSDIIKQDSNVYMGGLKSSSSFYKSSQNADFIEKPIKLQNPVYTHNDIFYSHHNLGYRQKSRRKSSVDVSKMDDSSVLERKINMIKISKSHLSLGTEKTKNVSQYSQTHIHKNGLPASLANNKHSSVLMGTNCVDYASLYSASFHPNLCAPENPVFKSKTFSNITMGSYQSNPHLHSSNHKFMRAAGNFERLKLSEEKRSSSHLSLGHDKAEFETTTSIDFKTKIITPTSLFLQKGNIDKPQNGDFRTIQKESFKWITPVPE